MIIPATFKSSANAAVFVVFLNWLASATSMSTSGIMTIVYIAIVLRMAGEVSQPASFSYQLAKVMGKIYDASSSFHVK